LLGTVLIIVERFLAGEGGVMRGISAPKVLKETKKREEDGRNA
jgi:hypothetical protein